MVIITLISVNKFYYNIGDNSLSNVQFLDATPTSLPDLSPSKGERSYFAKSLLNSPLRIQ
jgi:hypothetical protein